MSGSVEGLCLGSDPIPIGEAGIVGSVSEGEVGRCIHIVTRGAGGGHCTLSLVLSTSVPPLILYLSW